MVTSIRLLQKRIHCLEKEVEVLEKNVKKTKNNINAINKRAIKEQKQNQERLLECEADRINDNLDVPEPDPKSKNRDKKKEKQFLETQKAINAKRSKQLRTACECGCAEDGKCVKSVASLRSGPPDGNKTGFWSTASSCCRNFLERHDPGKVIPREKHRLARRSGSRLEVRKGSQAKMTCSGRSLKDAHSGSSASTCSHQSSSTHVGLSQCDVCSSTCPLGPPAKSSFCCRKKDPQNIDKFFKDLAKTVKTLNPCMQADIKNRFSEVVDEADIQTHSNRPIKPKKKKSRCCRKSSKKEVPDKHSPARTASKGSYHAESTEPCPQICRDKWARPSKSETRAVREKNVAITSRPSRYECNDYTCPAPETRPRVPSRRRSSCCRRRKSKSRSPSRSRSPSPTHHHQTCSPAPGACARQIDPLSVCTPLRPKRSKTEKKTSKRTVSFTK